MTWIISSLLFLKGIEVTAIYISDYIVDDIDAGIFDTIYNTSELVFYLIELGPPLVILLGQWKTYKECIQIFTLQEKFQRMTSGESSDGSEYHYSNIIKNMKEESSPQHNIFSCGTDKASNSNQLLQRLFSSPHVNDEESINSNKKSSDYIRADKTK